MQKTTEISIQYDICYKGTDTHTTLYWLASKNAASDNLL